MSHCRGSSRLGWTLIELLVVVAVIGIVSAISVVAVQASREAARRAKCANNMRNIGLAILNFESGKKHFPPAMSMRGTWISAIADFIEVRLVKPDDATIVWYEQLTCPSDAGELVSVGDVPRATINYAGCSGVYPYRATGYTGVFDPGRVYGFRVSLPYVQAKDITRGLSNVAMVSENARGGRTVERLNSLFNLPHPPFSESEVEDFREMCMSIPNRPTDYGWFGSPDRGTHWHPPSGGGVGLTLYNHALPPNQPSCVNGTNIARGLAPPTSYHPGGVNLVFCDGHVQFISDQVDRIPWEAMGRRRE